MVIKYTIIKITNLRYINIYIFFVNFLKSNIKFLKTCFFFISSPHRSDPRKPSWKSEFLKTIQKLKFKNIILMLMHRNNSLQKTPESRQFNSQNYISVVITRLQVVHICNVCSTISVHVAQWLEHLTGYQKVTGCTHM